VMTIASSVLTTTDINGGTIDGADITVGAGKTLDVSAGTLTLANDQISGDKVEGGTINATTITTLTSTTVNATTVDSTNLEVTNLKAKDGTAAGSIANSTGVTTLNSAVLTTADINGGTIDGVTIGGSSAGAITGTTITGTSFVTSGNMTFGDNDKAIFGAGSDLQIYHDGADSYIQDVGTGSLYVDAANNIILRNKTDNAWFIRGESGAQVSLYHNGNKKLDTTSTGIDVTGTAASDSFQINQAAAGANLDDAVLTSENFGYNFILPFDAGANQNAVKLRASYAATGGGLHVYTSTAGGAYASDATAYADYAERLKIATNGDISFYEDTGTTAKFFWDASAESLGIGTSSPLRSLHVSGAGDTSIMLQTTNAVNDYEIWEIQAAGNASNYADLIFRTRTNAGTGGTEAMRIDSSGRVGIGTSSPASDVGVAKILEVESSTAGIKLTATGGASMELYAAPTVGYIENTTSSPMVFRINTTERMRIDGSGNLLVGTTNATLYNATSGTGMSYRNGVALDIARQNTVAAQPCLNLNLTGVDGSHVIFYRDGTTVGSIGAYSGNLIAGSGSTALRFDGIADSIVPRTTANVIRADTIDLGDSTNRFKNLYLSGGVYLGGTGSANYLDDYEEGTWTATMSSGSVTADRTTYTKVGRLVTVQARLLDITDYTTAAAVLVQGLPFTVSSSGGSHIGSVMYRYINVGRNTIIAQTSTSATTFAFVGVSADNSLNWSTLQYSDATAPWDIFVSLTYETDS